MEEQEKSQEIEGKLGEEEQRWKLEDGNLNFDESKRKTLIHFTVAHHSTVHMWSVGVAGAGLA